MGQEKILGQAVKKVLVCAWYVAFSVEHFHAITIKHNCTQESHYSTEMTPPQKSSNQIQLQL